MRLLDLFCCAGGAGAGYAQAGFTEVVGVDRDPQPHYPFTFIRADVLELEPAFLAEFDAVHASPPCQFGTALRTMHNAKDHPNLIPATRELLRAAGRPYVIENVERARPHLIDPVRLCGTSFGLGAAAGELQRHRLFETSFPILFAPPCQHSGGPVLGVYGGHVRDRRRLGTPGARPDQGRDGHSISVAGELMGIGWTMTGEELSQAIPPAFTRWLGARMLEVIAGTEWGDGSAKPPPRQSSPVGGAPHGPGPQ